MIVTNVMFIILHSTEPSAGGGLAVTKLDGVCAECKTPYQWSSNQNDRHKKRFKAQGACIDT